LSESGLAGYDTSLWNGIWAPKGTPQPIVASVNEVIRKMNGTAEGKAQLARTGTEALATTPDEFATFLNSEVKKWAKLVEISGAKVD
jgi:tripartite-type tricarboxylate transporter receptor subunit TctC